MIFWRRGIRVVCDDYYGMIHKAYDALTYFHGHCTWTLNTPIASTHYISGYVCMPLYKLYRYALCDLRFHFYSEMKRQSLDQTPYFLRPVLWLFTRYCFLESFIKNQSFVSNCVQLCTQSITKKLDLMQ